MDNAFQYIKENGGERSQLTYRTIGDCSFSCGGHKVRQWPFCKIQLLVTVRVGASLEIWSQNAIHISCLVACPGLTLGGDNKETEVRRIVSFLLVTTSYRVSMMKTHKVAPDIMLDILLHLVFYNILENLGVIRVVQSMAIIWCPKRHPWYLKIIGTLQLACDALLNDARMTQIIYGRL